MRWQVEAAEKKQREEDEVNRVIAEKAKERLIAVIINPDDYYGCDLPNVPYGKPRRRCEVVFLSYLTCPPSHLFIHSFIYFLY